MVRTPMKERLLAMLGIAAGTGLLAVGLATMPATAASVEPVSYEDNPKAHELYPAYESWLKIDDINEVPVAGTYGPSIKPTGTKVATHGTMPDGLEIVISKVVDDEAAKRVYFDWAATALDDEGVRVPFRINLVLVKFANGGLAYHYGQPGVTGDAELYSTKDSMSHIDFAWGEDDDTTTSINDNGNGTVTTPVIVTVPETPTTAPTQQTIPFDEEPVTVPPTVLPTVVEPTTTTLAPATVAPATEAPAATEQVLGVTVERQLPRTGATSLPLAQIGFGLLLAGAGLLAHSRRFAYDER